MYFNEKNDDNTNIDSEFGKKSNSIIDKKMLYIIIGVVVLLLLILLIALLNKKKPVEYSLVLDGDTDIVMFVGSKFNEAGYRAYDSNGKDYTDKVLVEGEVDTSVVGSYSIEYSFNDIVKTRNITIVNEATNETYLTLNGDKIMFLKLGEKFTDPGYIAYDSKDKDINSKVNVSGLVNENVPGTYRLNYSLIGSSGVTLLDERIIIIMDSDISLTVVNPEEYTNDKVSIQGYAIDNYLDYILLPNGSKETNRKFTYDVTENGIYKFIVYSKNGLEKEKSIEVKNIDKTLPTGSCNAIVEGNTSVMVTASDNVEIVGYNYVIDGKETGFISDRNYVSNVLANSVSVMVKDKAKNVSNITCSVEKVEVQPSYSSESSSYRSSERSSSKSSSKSSSRPSYPSGDVTLINTSSYYLVGTKNDVLSFAKTVKNRKVSQDQGYSGYCLSFGYYFAYLLYAGTQEQINNMTAQEASEYTYATKFHDFKNDSKTVTLQMVYDLIKAGQPVVLHVNGKTSATSVSRHYVTVVGIKKTATRSTIKETDLLIIDVADGNLERMDVSGSRYMITGYDTGRTGSKAYGYQLYVLK